MHLNLKLFTFLTTLVFASSAFGDEKKILLKQSMQSGKTYELAQEMKMNSQISMPGTDQTMEQNMQMDISMEMSVTQPTPEEKKIAMKYTAMKTTMDMMGQTMTMDASDPAQKEAMGPILDIKPVIVLDKEDNFVRVEGVEEYANNPALSSLTDPAALKQSINGMMGELPKEAIAPGHKWESQTDLPIPNMGNVKMTIKNEFKSIEEIDGVKCARIDFTGTFGGSVKQQGMEVSFEKGSTFSGTIHFDPKLGYNRKQDIEMNMIMGMQMPGSEESMEIPMNIKQVVRLLKVKDNK